MSNVAKLKKRALEYEQKKQFDKALDTYVLVLAELDEHVDEADVALYNRVGDLLLKKGDVSDAVDHYEKAVDLYTEGGFFNNAIALCNKILRNAPGRTSVYYKLGKISAQKGFINDAKQNFLEFADRMQRAGEMEKAFSALKEFADLCPDQDDIRLMLADQLVKRDRKSEAIQQLQSLYEKFSAEGRSKEARATVDRMKAIDANFEPTIGTARPTPRSNDLIFLDVDYDTGKPKVKPPKRAAPEPEPEPEPEHAGPLAVPDIELPSISVASGQTPASGAVIDGLSHGSGLAEEKAEDVAGIVSHVDSGLITGFEETGVAASEEPPAVEPVAGLVEHVTEEHEAKQAPEPEAGSDLPMLDVPETLEESTPPEIPSFDTAKLARATSGLTLIMPDLEADSAPPAPPAAVPPKKTAREPEPEAPAAAASAAAETKGAGKKEAKPEPKTDPKAGKSARRATPPAPALADLRGLEEEGASVIDEAFAAGIASSVDDLRERALHEPENWPLRRELGEALLENGERPAGLKSLEEAMGGFERAGDFGAASSISEELLRVDPNSVRYHQKRVEYAVRSNDRPRLVEAYLALAECLFRSGQLDKSRAVYGRVLELAPDDVRAQSAMREAFGTRELNKAAIQQAAADAIAAAGANGGAAAEPPAERRRSETPPAGSDPSKRPSGPRRESFVNLSEWLRDEEPDKNTRLVASGAEPPTEQVGFAEMLSMFKQGVASNVDDTDHESHYDLGVAYKEMGLLDEAISEFQKALRGTEQRVRTYEALGQCFVEKRQYQIALTILARALTDKAYGDETLVGVLYLLGYASESLGQMDEALKYYERVFAVDIQFRDIGDRLAAVERKAR